MNKEEMIDNLCYYIALDACKDVVTPHTNSGVKPPQNINKKKGRNKMINYNNSSEAQKEYIQERINSEIYCTMDDVVRDNQWELDDLENQTTEVCSNCGADNEELCECDNYEQTWQEVFEWYFVSQWLGDKLHEIGEPIERNFSGKALWGRTCSGQAIILDSTFWEVFQEWVEDV